MNIKQGIGCSGEYEITLLKGKSKKPYTVIGPCKNLLTNGFFARFLSGTLQQAGYIFVGTGSTPPEFTDTQLENQLGSGAYFAFTDNGVVKEGSDYFSRGTFVGTFGLGAIVGNVSEVGLKFRAESSGTALDSRALIVDGLGAPTTLTVTADDQLIVTYRFRYKIPTVPHISVKVFGGVSTTCTLETLAVFAAGWPISSVLSATPFAVAASFTRLSATQNLYNNVESTVILSGAFTTTVSYGATATARTVTYSASPSQANIAGGIKYMQVYAQNHIRQGILFEPNLAKDVTKILTLVFEYTLTRL